MLIMTISHKCKNDAVMTFWLLSLLQEHVFFLFCMSELSFLFFFKQIFNFLSPQLVPISSGRFHQRPLTTGWDSPADSCLGPATSPTS